MTDPRALRTAAEFSAALARMRHELGKSVRAVSRETGIPAATLGGYFSGRHLPAATYPGPFRRLLRELGVPAEELGAWRDALIRVRRAPDAGGSTNPFLGVAAYDIEDQWRYAGRERLVDEALDRLHDSRGVVVVGAAGAGTSSFLRAGLLAALLDRGRPVTVVDPDHDPAKALADAATQVGADGVIALDRPDAASLETLADEPPDATVVVALRDEDADAAESLAKQQVRVEPPDEAELRRMIAEPVRRAGRVAEPTFVDLVVRDAAGADADATLRLVSEALRRTWVYTTGAVLTPRDYAVTGGVEGAAAALRLEAWLRR